MESLVATLNDKLVDWWTFQCIHILATVVCNHYVFYFSLWNSGERLVLSYCIFKVHFSSGFLLTFIYFFFNLTLLYFRVSEAGSRPRSERRSIRIRSNDDSDDEEPGSSYSFSPTPSATPSAPPSAPTPATNGSYYSGPFKAVYDFESGKKSLCNIFVQIIL